MANIEIRAFSRRFLLVWSKTQPAQPTAPTAPTTTSHHNGLFEQANYWRDDHAADVTFGFRPKRDLREIR